VSKSRAAIASGFEAASRCPNVWAFELDRGVPKAWLLSWTETLASVRTLARAVQMYGS